MTLRRWLRSLVWMTLWTLAFIYAVYRIHNAWGMVILGGMYVEGFCFLVNTIDLLVGRWIRRGKGHQHAY